MDQKEMLEKMEKEEGFFHHNHYHVVEANDNNVIIRADIDANSLNPYGTVHGGLIFGLGDTVMGMVARTTGRRGVTLNANIEYLRPGKGSYITAKGELIKNGKTTCFVRANIYDEEERLIATMDSNYYFID